MTRRGDGRETWHRLLQWDKDSASAERLAAIILSNDGFSNIDPSHPLGGRDGKKDIIFTHNEIKWIAGVYFPRGEKSFKKIKDKFTADLEGVEANNASGIAFVTNQELSLSERQDLIEMNQNVEIEIYHLERISTILNTPKNYGVRLEFLDIEMTREEQLAFFAIISSLSNDTRTPSLSLKGLYDGNFTNDLHVRAKSYIKSSFMEDKESEIEKLYNQVNDYIFEEGDITPIIQSQPSIWDDVIKNSRFQYETVDVISTNMQKMIANYCQHKDLPFADTFFYTGNLKKTKSNFTVLGSSPYSTHGTEKEEEKYQLIQSLYWKVREHNEYYEYFSALESKYFVPCVLSNLGTSFDEDIDVKLVVQKDHMCIPSHLPVPGASIIELCNKAEMEELLFTLIHDCLVDVEIYTSYPRVAFNASSLPISFPFNRKSASEEYQEEAEAYNDALERVFCYNYYDTSQYDIWSFNIPYLKQNTNMSFPTMLTFNKLPEFIVYEIRSKHLSDVLTGQIKIIV
ncbi:MAG: hypothetical protein FWC73_10720 [Defluviitaleaceae bacterium]|nr:hypothetical protein [Defluviitaleaceae bacterium]